MQRLSLLACVSITCLMSQARAAPLDTSQGIASDLSFIEPQVSKTLSSLGSSPVPEIPSIRSREATAERGRRRVLRTYAQGWTTGFFPGQLWLLYQATGSQQWLTRRRLGPRLWPRRPGWPSRSDPTDIGFIIGTSFGNGYRLTGDPAYKQVLNTTGKSLASLYNPNVGAVQSWTFPQYHFPVIIDSMMTLGPLQWGASNGGSSTWAGIAATHAQTVTKNLVRPNGSTFQVADFDPMTGGRRPARGHSRGAYSAYVDLGARAGLGPVWVRAGLSDVRQSSIPDDGRRRRELFRRPVARRPYLDPALGFRRAGGAPVDTSAAAIAADGLVMLSTVAGTLGASYLLDAENILGSLSSSYLDVDPTGESVLIDGFPGNGGTNTALIYGDYYFTEALLRLQNVLDGKPGWVLYSPTVPEPSTWAMMLLGFAGMGFAGYRRARVGRTTHVRRS